MNALIEIPAVLSWLGMTLVDSDGVDENGCRSWCCSPGVHYFGLSARVMLHRDGTYSATVSKAYQAEVSVARRSSSVTVWDLATPEDAAQAWLDAASIDAPILCGAVVDGMAIDFSMEAHDAGTEMSR